MRVLDLALPAGRRRRCRVRIGRGALMRLVDELVTELPARRPFLISDTNVAPLHAEPLAARLSARGRDASLLVFPAGEASKTRETKAALEDELLARGADRHAVIVAVGGGVAGDLAGFVASTWHRGVPVVQVPTSLVAMADAAIGGKTAVDLPGGKNLVGSFHQPWGVYADVDVLETLPDDRLGEGFAEIVKGAAIGEPGWFARLERSAERLVSRDVEALEEAVSRSVRQKARIVSRDEREQGRRAMLNFGHTVAHALEAASGWSMSHGHAVAIGLVVEARLAAVSHEFPGADVTRLVRLLERLGLPTRVPAAIDPGRIVAATRRDKKSRHGRARYALPLGLGRMPPGDEITVELSEADLAAALAASRSV